MVVAGLENSAASTVGASGDVSGMRDAPTVSSKSAFCAVVSAQELMDAFQGDTHSTPMVGRMPQQSLDTNPVTGPPCFPLPPLGDDHAATGAAAYAPMLMPNLTTELLNTQTTLGGKEDCLTPNSTLSRSALGSSTPSFGSCSMGGGSSACPPHGVKAVCGKRAKMEDAYVVHTNFFELPLCLAVEDMTAACSKGTEEVPTDALPESQYDVLPQQAAGQGPQSDLELGSAKDSFLGGSTITACNLPSSSSMATPPGSTDILHFYGVYDGHGGVEAAQHCATRLHHNLSAALTAASGGKPHPEDALPFPGITTGGAAISATCSCCCSPPGPRQSTGEAGLAAEDSTQAQGTSDTGVQASGSCAARETGFGGTETAPAAAAAGAAEPTAATAASAVAATTAAAAAAAAAAEPTAAAAAAAATTATTAAAATTAGTAAMATTAAAVAVVSNVVQGGAEEQISCAPGSNPAETPSPAPAHTPASAATSATAQDRNPDEQTQEQRNHQQQGQPQQQADSSHEQALNLKTVVSDAATLSTALEDALRGAFLKTDEEFAADCTSSTVGSTAVVALLGSRRVWIANCGDSRAVLCRGGKAIQLTDDHKPEREDEAERVEKAGGQVLFWNGHRVMGVLAMSRAIGDHGLRPYVIPEPEITVLVRTDDDDFLLMASDGLWDVMSNQEATQLAIRCMGRARDKGASRKAAVRVAANVLTSAAIDRGSKDNVTVLIVDLKAKAGARTTSAPSEPGAEDTTEAAATAPSA